MEYDEICTNFLEIIAGTNNTISSAYIEASNNLANNDTAIKYLKNFITSIENVASKPNAIDKRIVDSKGNVKDFSSYENIEKSLKFLSTHKTPSGNNMTTDLKTLHDLLEKYQSYYMEGYRKNVRLLMLEYESCMYLLVTGLSMALQFNFEVTEANGIVKLLPKPKAYFGVTGKKLHEMVEELKKKNHEEYLDQILKTANMSGTGSTDNVNESVMFTEASGKVADTLDLITSLWHGVKNVFSFGVNGIKTIKANLFGIIPLIRSAIYLSYKRKADSILSLEESISFIEQNIERLQNRTNMNEKEKANIIKKQKAKVEAYKKRAEKLRAQFEEGEKEASEILKNEDPKMKNIDDDFVLESVDDDDEYVNMLDSEFDEATYHRNGEVDYDAGGNQLVKAIPKPSQTSASSSSNSKRDDVVPMTKEQWVFYTKKICGSKASEKDIIDEYEPNNRVVPKHKKVSYNEYCKKWNDGKCRYFSDKKMSEDEYNRYGFMMFEYDRALNKI